MNKIAKIALAATIVLSVGATSAVASPEKGQKLYTKKLKKACGITGAALSAKHTQDEWSDINAAGKLAAEIKSICPNADDGALKDKYLPSYFDFLHEYGSDSGNVPTC